MVLSQTAETLAFQGVENKPRRLQGAPDAESIAELQRLNKAVSQNPCDPEVWTARGNLHFSPGLGPRAKPMRGMADYDTAISINPRCVNAWRGKAVALFAQRQYEAAADALTAAIKNGGGCCPVYLRRALCYKRLGMVEETKRELVNIIKRADGSEEAKAFARMLLEEIKDQRGCNGN